MLGERLRRLGRAQGPARGLALQGGRAQEEGAADRAGQGHLRQARLPGFDRQQEDREPAALRLRPRRLVLPHPQESLRRRLGGESQGQSKKVSFGSRNREKGNGLIFAVGHLRRRLRGGRVRHDEAEGRGAHLPRDQRGHLRNHQDERGLLDLRCPLRPISNGRPIILHFKLWNGEETIKSSVETARGASEIDMTAEHISNTRCA